MRFLLLLALSMATAWVTANANVNNNEATYLNIATELETYLAARTTQGDLPLSTEDAVVKNLLVALSNQERYLSDQFGVDDMPYLMSICGKANQITMGYLLNGLPLENMTVSAENLAAILDANAKKYQTELAYIQPFNTSCLAKQVRPLEVFFANLSESQKTPVRLAGVKKVQLGANQIFQGVLGTLVDADYSQDFKLTMLTTLAENAVNLFRVLPEENRHQVLNDVDRLQAVVPKPYGELLHKIKQTTSDIACENFCTIELH